MSDERDEVLWEGEVLDGDGDSMGAAKLNHRGCWYLWETEVLNVEPHWRPATPFEEAECTAHLARQLAAVREESAAKTDTIEAFRAMGTIDREQLAAEKARADAAEQQCAAKDETIKALSLRTSENTIAAKAARQAVTRARYHERLPAIDDAARRLGYAIGLHGSETRDFDLIAVPWTSEAASAESLAEAIREAVGGVFNEREGVEPNPGVRAHGRLCWSIGIGGEDRYIDLSVMPASKECE